MIRSMTGFAREQKQLENVQLCWEIRAVNHRYLDVSFRLPESFRFMEPQFRLTLKNTIYRGKLECQLKYQDTNSEKQSVVINKGLIDALVECSHQISASHQVANDLTVSQIIAWPGVIATASCDMEQLGQAVLALFKSAVGQLNQFRADEGLSLKNHIMLRLNHLNEEVTRAKAITINQMLAAKTRLLARLNLIKLEVAEGRMEQELALIIARMDVTEELDRLSTHIEEVKKALEGKQSAGRRLDFLMQELNREANTLSSKSDSSELTQTVIEMKVLIEQMREQIQNIE